MSKRKTLTILGALIILLSVVAVTYGYISANVESRNQEVSVQAGTMELTFADNDAGIAQVLNFGDTITKKFTLENTGTATAFAKISWLNLVNTYLEGSLIYTFEYSNSVDGTYRKIVTDKNVPRSETASKIELADAIAVPGNTKFYYNLHITLVNSPTVDQTADLNASFHTQFTLDNGISPSDKTLALLGLNNQVKKEPTAYNMFDYTWAGYQKNEETFKPEKVDGIGTTEGIYSMEDDFGTSYYFRGSKALNNIVKFGKYDTDMYYYLIEKSDGEEVYSTGSLTQCQAESSNVSKYCTDSYKYASAGDDMYWRIVRINGDGTLRLMYIGTSATATGINSYAGRSHFNSSYDDPKYSGYTYDNSAPNVQDGTASDMKNYLDTWYARSMSSEDANIATGQFYSDTTGYEYNRTQYRYIYSSTKRLNKRKGYTTTVSPTLKTSMTTETYGGIYNLKVGLLNVDELVLSGIDGINGTEIYDESGESHPYTVNSNSGTWSLSPAPVDGVFVNLFHVHVYGHVEVEYGFTYADVRPVINLSAEYARQLTGSGSKTSPYTVQ